MYIDLTMEISPKQLNLSSEYNSVVSLGHLGTHFDVMDKTFPLEYLQRQGIIFNVAGLEEITSEDIDLTEVKKDQFVGFSTGFYNKSEYGSKEYFSGHPQLSKELIQVLVDIKVSIIGVDTSGVRGGKDHKLMDQFCADNNVFIIENLRNFESILLNNNMARCPIYTFPLNYKDMSGLPCRVIADV